MTQEDTLSIGSVALLQLRGYSAIESVVLNPEHDIINQTVQFAVVSALAR